ncbi:MAG: hypothetical protein CFH06_01778 [Alphaproteobacteria bacterium MarineAlpha3_Bin5]|nr:hypothetical protein [Magnetovibrio sp.]PPR76233.1 MAG: hypothetical protein CFH06_01778 [Alphaproteobacteria bacterium MarineAlpha3_Bin5]
MFNKKTDKSSEENSKPDDSSNTNSELAPPLKPFSKKGSHIPNKPPVSSSFQLEPHVTRKTEIPRGPDRKFKPQRNSDIDSKTLIVGRSIELRGEITSCDHLIIEGYVEITLPGARVLEISTDGRYKGSAEVEVADISGRFEGDLTARDRLIVRSGGRIFGKVRYGRIVIESGGEVAGEMKTLDPTSFDETNNNQADPKNSHKKSQAAKKRNT